ncbi:MAG: aminoacyl-tRNA hydrolase [Candidatus Methylomirabilales bacterium]
MWLIVGLGNPGSEYAQSRHNVGFVVLDELARRQHRRIRRRRWESLYAEGRVGREPIALVKPLSLMNQSGWPVKAWLEKWSVPSERLVVVHDDLDLAFGRIKVLARGGHGGHRGVHDIQEAIETVAFPRVRVGIGRPDHGDEVRFVLSPFDEVELRGLPELVGRAADAVEEIVEGGVGSAMNRFNVRRRFGGRREPAEPSPEEVRGCQSTR